MRKREILRAGTYAYNPYKFVSFKVNGIEVPTAIESRFAPIVEQEIIDVRLAAEYLKKFALQGGSGYNKDNCGDL